MSLDLCHRSATDLAAAIRAGDLSPVDLVRAHLDRIAALGERTNAFVTVLVDEARLRVRRRLRRRSARPVVPPRLATASNASTPSR